MKAMLVAIFFLVGCASTGDKSEILIGKKVTFDKSKNEFKVYESISKKYPGLVKSIEETFVPGIYIGVTGRRGCDPYFNSELLVGSNFSERPGWVYVDAPNTSVSKDGVKEIYSHIHKNMPDFLIDIPGNNVSTFILVSAVDSEKSAEMEKILSKYNISYKIMPTFTDPANANFAKALTCSENAAEAWKAARSGEDRIKPRRSCNFKTRDARDIICMVANRDRPTLILSDGSHATNPVWVENFAKKYSEIYNEQYRNQNK